MEALAKPRWGVCKREVRIQESGVRIVVHVAGERVLILHSEFWLLNTALAEPTKEVLQAPQWAVENSPLALIGIGQYNVAFIFINRS
jgi:hypothetical protein